MGIFSTAFAHKLERKMATPERLAIIGAELALMAGRA
jgi:hypothetical protein